MPPAQSEAAQSTGGPVGGGVNGRRDGTIVVVGGGCYGSYYVRQLSRAADAGALSWERLVVVDRDPECRVARAKAGATAGTGAGAPPHVEDASDVGAAAHHLRALDIEVSPWDAFFA